MNLERHNSRMPDEPTPDVSLVIPVFNEQEGLAALFERITRLCDSLPDVRCEVLFVDDHSRDESPQRLRAACQRDPRFRFLRLSANRGSHIAIFAGLQHCRGRCAVFLAADLQDPPELVVQMLERWRGGSQVVWAVRAQREGIPFSERVFANAFYFTFNKLANVSLPPQGSDFALLDRAVIDALMQSISASPFLMGEIAQAGFRQSQVEYVKEARRFGTTKWNLRKKLKLFADAFVACSYTPLRAMSYLGLAMSVFGFAYALLVICLRLVMETQIEGWASLMVVVLVLGGVQMVMLGVLGEYLWRTLEHARRRPLYFIEEPRSTPPAAEARAEVLAARSATVHPGAAPASAGSRFAPHSPTIRSAVAAEPQPVEPPPGGRLI